jgi:hypothetical protein
MPSSGPVFALAGGLAAAGAPALGAAAGDDGCCGGWDLELELDGRGAGGRLAGWVDARVLTGWDVGAVPA